MNGTTMAMPMNQATLMTAPVFNPNVKDSRWLTLEVCREYTRNKCTRSDQECKFAHPPPHVEVQNGRVTCCFDSIKGKCQRKDPPCKYLHPPQHLKEQLLQNGRNNLILKNLQMQALAAGGMPGAVVPGLIPTVAYENPTSNGKATTIPLATHQMLGQYGHLLAPQYMMQHPSPFNPYVNNGGMGLIQEAGTAPISVSSAGSPQMASAGMISAAAGMSQKVPRPDRLESSPVIQASSGSGSNSWNGHPSHGSPSDTIPTSASQYNPIYFQPQHMVEVLNTTSKKRPRDPADDLLLGVNHIPGMVPIVKRPATLDGKSGIPMYQPTSNSSAVYQQTLAAMQLQQQYIPTMTSDYLTGHPPGMPRF